MRRSLSLMFVLSLSLAACKKEPAPEAPPAEPKTAAPAKPAKPAEAPTPEADPNDIPAPDDVAAPPADAEKTASGLSSKVLQAGTGTEKPKATDKVFVHYTGWTKDGKMFDSSVKRGKKISFGLDQVIPGWTEGLQLMVKGEKRRFWIPGNLAYGDTPSRPGAPAGQLTFDVELFDVFPTSEPVPGPIAAPKDVKKAPKAAKQTESGLQYIVLKKGEGTVHPGPTSEVLVHYTGWQAKDGKMFDSSVVRGQMASFPLNRVIPGWTEGLQLMVEGEKTRFWIPGKMAYGEESAGGRPGGLLVFDVELFKILD